MVDPKYLTSSTIGGANSNYINSNTTAGTYGAIPYLYGPHGFYQDVSLTKEFPLYREARVKFQGVAQNAWNHPVFGNTGTLMDVSAQSTTFGEQSGPSNSPRSMDVRLTVEF
jgi:hypothetical protein